jgi:hypothetical protein
MAEGQVGRGVFPKPGGRRREVLCPKGTASPFEGEAAVDGVSETRSHAVGQSLDKRTLFGG